MVKVSVVFGREKIFVIINLEKSADILLKSKGFISTFFVGEKLNFGCRDPPFINSVFLNFELIGGKNGENTCKK